MERNRQVAIHALGAQDRAAEYPQGFDLQVVGPERPLEKLARRPGQVNIGGLKPDALLIAHGQPANADVAPDVAAESLDAEPAQPTNRQAVRPSLQQQATLRGQSAVANAQHSDEQQADGHGQGDRDHPHDRTAPARGHDLVRRAQKL